MARRHRRHHRRHGRSFGLFGLKLPKVSGPVKDTGIGALIGIAGAGAAMFGANAYNEKAAASGGTLLGPQFLLWAPAMGGVAFGSAAYLYKKKRDHSKATAYLVGSSLAGIVISIFKWIQQNYSAQFGDLVKVKLAGYGNVLVKQGALGNLLLAGGGAGAGATATARGARLGRLGAMAMSPAARAAMGGMRGYMRVRG